MATNNVITNMFDGITRDYTLEVEGVVKSAGKSNDIFSNLLKQGTSSFDGTKQSTEKTKITSKYEDSVDSYDRYQYKKSQIDSGNPLKDKIEQSAENVESFARDVVEVVAEQLEMTEEDVVEAIQMLGITVFDLLDPQVLAQFTVEMTGVEDASALLLDSNFQSMLVDVTQMGKNFMEELNLNTEQMQILVSNMEVLEQPEDIQNVEEINFTEILGSNVQTTPEEQVAVQNDDKVVETSNLKASEVVTTDIEDTEVNNANNTNATNDIKSDASNDISLKPVEQEENMSEDFQENSTNEDMMNKEKQPANKIEITTAKAANDNVEHVFSNIEQTTNDASNVVKTAEVTPNNTYVSVDTVRIIEQLAEKVKISNFSEISSIEMQLNPENLGKMYVNISSKQGFVNAQISATNEIVKEALETQVHELRETLQQSGVKVDAIEVTIASHEFEKNLEQGQSREEQEAQRQEEMKEKNRKDINLSDFDDLPEVLTEDEALIAQIMKDNGNSFDYTV